MEIQWKFVVIVTIEFQRSEFQPNNSEANDIWQMIKTKSADCGRLKYIRYIVGMAFAFFKIIE